MTAIPAVDNRLRALVGSADLNRAVASGRVEADATGRIDAAVQPWARVKP
ncbi:MAG: hypothetical protein ACYCT1_14015 [Steroidobacteraceae bacterium]